MTIDRPDLDLLLVARYALLAALCHLIPIPLLDALADTFLRRRLTRLQLRAAQVEVPRKRVGMLSDGSAGGCLGLVWSVVSWPFKRALRYVIWVLLLKGMIDTFSDVVARAVMIHEALAIGALPGEARDVRVAMQRALARTNVKPLERAVGIVFRSSRGELLQLLRQARGRMRLEARRERTGQATDASDSAPLSGELEPLSEALARALWVPEVHEALREQFREQAVSLGLPGDADAAARETADPVSNQATDATPPTERDTAGDRATNPTPPTESGGGSYPDDEPDHREEHDGQAHR